MLRIEVTSYNGKPVADPTCADFGDAGGTIGRSPDNTLVLLDPERKISRTHASLSQAGDGYLIRDQGSVVPVLLNGQPLGNGREARIVPGDEIRIAGYVMSVRGDALAPPAAQAAAEPDDGHVSGAADEQLAMTEPEGKVVTAKEPEIEPISIATAEPEAIPEPAEKTQMTEPVLSWTQAEAPGSVEAVTTIILSPTGQSFMDEETAEADAAEFAATRIEPSPNMGTAAWPSSTPEDDRSTMAASPASPNDALLRALLVGAGLRDLGIPGGLTPELMNQLGRLLREATSGLLDLLAARAMTKREVRADMTVIVAKDNNPLKFSPDMEAALTHLLAPRGRGFMPPLRAVGDAYDDLRAHQLGFMAGMRSALAVVLARFDPHALEQKLAGASVVDSFLPTHRKAKLWDLFGELYGAISRDAQTDFHLLFGHEFLRAYKAHVAKLPERGGSARQ